MFVCSNCGEGSSTWIGRCPACKEWNTFKEMREAKEGRAKGEKKQSLAITSFKNIASQKNTRKKTGLFELDRVLGGGIVPGSIILLTGEPGVGKSTLLLQALKGLKTLYISGEESAEQVKERAERLEVDLDQFLFSDTLQVEGIVSGVQEQKDLDVIVIDSIQTVYSRNA
ncbi:MAG: ATPase domain-containing protein, partial [Weeksellaceae bacterium]